MILPDYLHEKNMKIIDRYGLDHQLIQLMEECGELIQKISKYFRAKEVGGKSEIYQACQDMKLEMADVEVLYDQVRERINFTTDELNNMAAYKIDRTIGRINNDK